MVKEMEVEKVNEILFRVRQRKTEEDRGRQRKTEEWMRWDTKKYQDRSSYPHTGLIDMK